MKLYLHWVEIYFKKRGKVLIWILQCVFSIIKRCKMVSMQDGYWNITSQSFWHMLRTLHASWVSWIWFLPFKKTLPIKTLKSRIVYPAIYFPMLYFFRYNKTIIFVQPPKRIVHILVSHFGGDFAKKFKNVQSEVILQTHFCRNLPSNRTHTYNSTIKHPVF